ncbi:MAG: bifunctional phosphopantothenoylcysteine decarboxylase/phosphopantothenate--cysteine ligase CoaBC [Methanoregulaceae archaeon]|jgi:phosphopantothenoylcysteine decarboxylase/phosphopantothenate--cysteine ligase
MTIPQTLHNKEIVIGVTGSIAAVEIVKFIHGLRRKGAAVQVVMSDAASKIVHENALTYATGRPTITKLSGNVEHVAFCGDEGTADLLVIAPCTANTIGKIANGIDDTPVTTFATTALGSEMPVIIVPAMHHSMYRHPAVIKNINQLKEWGVTVIDPKIEEGKAKVLGTDEITLYCERAVLGNPLKRRRVLITSGSCREPVDDVRILTTRSSGKMGRELALQAFRLGADVTVVHHDKFSCVKNVFADSAQEMHDQVISILENAGTDIYISAAAISDFAPIQVKGKIVSGKSYTIELDPLPKLIDEVITKYKPITVAFKLGWKTAIKAQEFFNKGITMVVTNTPDVMGSDGGEFVLLTTDNNTTISGSKEVVAATIWNVLIEKIGGYK